MGYIYLLLNKQNGKKYVGQTTITIASRWETHLKDRRKLNTPLYKAMRRFGKASFEIQELEACESQANLNAREDYWIQKLGTLFPLGYNLRTGGSKGRHSQASIEKMRASHLGKQKGKKNPFYGRNHSATARRKMRAFWQQAGNANSRKIACKRGHLFDEANTRIRANGKRDCRICDRLIHQRQTRQLEGC